MNKINKLGLWIGATMMALPMVVAAEDLAPVDKIKDWTSLVSLLNTWVKNAIVILGVIAVGMIVFGAFQYVTGENEAGRKTVTNGLIGVIIAVSSFSLVTLVVSLIK